MNSMFTVMTIIATLASPVIAIQVQKFIERYNQKKNIKITVFTQLMATRAPSARLSTEHVRALNMIDLAFYGTIKKGKSKTSKAEKKVLTAWKIYFAHLCSLYPDNDAGRTLWNQSSNNLFIDLLSAIAEDIGYDFDRVQLQNSVYSPIAHGNIENEQEKIRKGLASVFAGESSLKMEITSMPNNSERPS